MRRTSAYSPICCSRRCAAYLPAHCRTIAQLITAPRKSNSTICCSFTLSPWSLSLSHSLVMVRCVWFIVNHCSTTADWGELLAQWRAWYFLPPKHWNETSLWLIDSFTPLRRINGRGGQPQQQQITVGSYLFIDSHSFTPVHLLLFTLENISIIAKNLFSYLEVYLFTLTISLIKNVFFIQTMLPFILLWKLLVQNTAWNA